MLRRKKPARPLKASLQEKLEKKGLNYGAIGIGGTLIYLGLVAWILFHNDVDLGSMSPNEWGDFQAGIFGPLALFWVVMGFWQQGAELRNSRDALILQAKELENSVVAQQDQVNALYAQIESSREIWELDQTADFQKSQPRLRLQATGSSGAVNDFRNFNFELLNVGELCSDLTIRSQDGETVDESKAIPILPNSEKIQLQYLIAVDKEDRDMTVTVDYSDKSGRKQVRYFVVTINGATLTVTNPNGQPKPLIGLD